MHTSSFPCSISDIFTCTRCGFCCHGETTVSLDAHDQQRMADVLGLTPEQARERYWRVTGSVVQMRVRDGHCIFFDADKGCTVHEGRPRRCRQWPLHPSILDDENNFLIITESCPGLRKELGYDKFCRIFRALIEQGAIDTFDQ
ncbi:MAG: YkgJ family cysteine cluster protein [Desulfobulbus sp.]